ncbi:MAG: FMN-binding glutamate synthase family protein [Clostridia bacterium]|nr:FMN-binding glutamate synthase family protein [Clostridia bacterium]
MNSLFDGMTERLLTEPYPENVYSLVPILNKIHLQNLVEVGMRAETGKPLSRPLGSPVVLSDWNRILLNPVHLFRLPTPDDVAIDTSVVIGPEAKRPLKLDIPILVSGMSYGGALSLRVKVALAKGASLAGTASNTGEAPLIPEEREAARFLIGQYNRGGWLNDDASLDRLDAIEIQLGQGAQAAAPLRTPAWMTGPEFRRLFGLRPGEDAVIHSRLAGVETPQDFVRLVARLKERHGVPVGLKIAATHHLERELEVALEAGIDYFVVDGAEAGTHGGPPILQDDVGLPTLHALARASRYLEAQGMKGRVSLIAAGGLVSPGQFLKALALGADAVYIGTIALLATLHTQMTKAAPFEPAVQAVLYTGRFHEDFDVEEGARDLANFLTSCVREMELATYALGKSAFQQLGRDDLCTVDPLLARMCRIDYAGLPPEDQDVLLGALPDKFAGAGEAAGAAARRREPAFSGS